MEGEFEQALVRFKMSPPPEPGIDKYEEHLTNWFLEGAFFRDFVYREQPGKKENSELADGLVLFDETALFMQSKAQEGTKESTSWAAKHIEKALDQVCYGERMLRERLVPTVVSDTLGPVAFDPDRYTRRMGLIIVRQEDHSPFVAAELVPELTKQGFPVHVLSLEDLMEVATRFDTAVDFLFYLEERRQLAEAGVPIEVHREIDMAQVMLRSLSERMREAMPDVPDDILARSVEAFRSKVSGELRLSEDWRLSLLVDDIIARMHDRDPGLPWNEGGTPSDAMLAGELLSQLDRVRRGVIGRKCLAAARFAADERPEWGAFQHELTSRSCSFVFVYMDASREKRLERARQFLGYAMVKAGTSKGLAVATQPAGTPARSYDVVVLLGPPSEDERMVLEQMPSPFTVGGDAC